MTGTETLVARSAVGAFGAAAGYVAVQANPWRTQSSRGFDRRLLVWFGATRLGLFCLAFFVLQIAPRGDIPAYYIPQALSARAGLLPYRDFGSSYAPLHPFLDGAVLTVWHSPLALILMAILTEILLLWTWLRLGRLLLPEAQVRLAALLYLTSPISLQYVLVDGQDNVAIALLVACALWLVLRRRETASGAALGISIAAFKFLPLIFVPPFVMSVRRPIRWLVGLASVLIPVYGLFLLRHAPVLYPLREEGSMKGAGNLPYLMESISGHMLPASVEDAAAMLALLLLYAALWRPLRETGSASRPRLVALAMAALTLTVLLFAKKSWPPYLMLTLFPLCFAVVRQGWTRLRVALWCGFSFVAVVEHSYWASVMGQAQSLEMHGLLLARLPQAFVLLGLELLLIAGYVWLLAECVRQIRAGDTVSAAASSV